MLGDDGVWRLSGKRSDITPRFLVDDQWRESGMFCSQSVAAGCGPARGLRQGDPSATEDIAASGLEAVTFLFRAISTHQTPIGKPVLSRHTIF
jgi:hypothetical protein